MVISELIKQYAPRIDKYEQLYRQLHAAPELSLCEKATAEVVASYLVVLEGFEVRTHVGGYGVVGILRNGGTKTVLLRAELDALPIAERTQLPYASTRTMSSPVSGVESPVMHACGHDLHMSALLAASELLHGCREHWQGTVVMLFQPSEENGVGARAMMEDGLYDPQRHNVPVPDFALGGHCMPLRTGLIKTRIGPINASADSFRITIFGRGGHAARPHTTVDPVVLACNIVTKLQQVVSRQVNPLEPAVLTVGSIHAGTTPNVIADKAILEINIRAFDVEVRSRIIDSMTRIIHGEAQIYNAPETPVIESLGRFPLLENNEKATIVVANAMKKQFGSNFDVDATASTGSEDFAALSTPPYDIPFVFWNYGCIPPDIWDDAAKENRLSDIPGQFA